ncbi:MAG: purine-nucleoside phosphorylase [Clostridia bacterium]|nr:purine-nucleoside phosphorylase [Clostridia bacterium]MBQ4587330.1 purine-nucleoside phosphorylase [Clostridia bacterium]MBQ6883395.1 purine-nucleoside phosphorylase [Clostridia bacterium]MBR2932730.1 purine-nucleoside phosphorylase [Clostridia bacterium]MBR6688052.1 purine-nucleoside phosphorylase [Clostridia bacterium]
MSIPTPHITAKKGDFAKTVLMPGDPKRSRFIAENYLENAVLVNDVRGVQGYTGYYKGKRVSVMASGMGQPAIGIYSYELFNFYDVSSIIRVGSCGSFDPDLRVRDIILAMGACTNGNYAMQYNLPGTFAPIADFGLLKKAAEECEKAGVNYKVGNIFSSDMFYDDANSGMDWAKMGVLGVEMESAALYLNAARAGKKALCICTVSDSFIHPEDNTTAEERQNSFTKMMEIALAIAEE